MLKRSGISHKEIAEMQMADIVLLGSVVASRTGLTNSFNLSSTDDIKASSHTVKASGLDSWLVRPEFLFRIRVICLHAKGITVPQPVT